jgi:hypothetical protein
MVETVVAAAAAQQLLKAQLLCEWQVAYTMRIESWKISPWPLNITQIWTRKNMC